MRINERSVAVESVVKGRPTTATPQAEDTGGGEAEEEPLRRPGGNMLGGLKGGEVVPQVETTPRLGSTQ
jgi:hypothetical protein